MRSNRLAKHKYMNNDSLNPDSKQVMPDDLKQKVQDEIISLIKNNGTFNTDVGWVTLDEDDLTRLSSSLYSLLNPTPSLQGAEQPAEGYFSSQAEFNKWLRDLTDDEKDHVISMLQEFAGASFQQSEAMEFAEWIGKSGYGDVEPLNTLPSRWLRLGVPKDAITTPELFQLFLQSKQQ